jgi:hypothetical protein
MSEIKVKIESMNLTNLINFINLKEVEKIDKNIFAKYPSR